MANDRYEFNAVVEEDHVLRLQLPDALPTGPVAVEVRFIGGSPSSPSQTGQSMSGLLEEIFARHPVTSDEELAPGFSEDHDGLILQGLRDGHAQGLH